MLFRKFLKIETKSGELVRFSFNPAQEKILELIQNRSKVFILKARQMGCTTLLKMQDLNLILSEYNKHCLTIAHTMPDAQRIFEKVRLSFNLLPKEIQLASQPKYNSVREISLDTTKSSILVSTSGRSGTFQRIHISEFAFFDRLHAQETLTGTLEALSPNGQLIIETTANGMNHAKLLWDKVNTEKTEWTPIFLAWFLNPEYSAEVPNNFNLKEEYNGLAISFQLLNFDDLKILGLSEKQIYWYFLKAKTLEELVKQEYPTTPNEAFLTTSRCYFKTSLVSQIQTLNPPFYFTFEDIYRVAIFKKPEKNKKYIIGIDTSHGVGSDSSTIEVLDAEELEEVASFNSNTISFEKLAELAIELARYFNNALIAPENNDLGDGTAQFILGRYSNVFMERTEDKITKKMTNRVGFNTNSKTRPKLIAKFRTDFHAGLIKINSEIIKSQMFTFVVKETESGVKIEHDEGMHDDSLFALMIAYFLKDNAGSSFIY